MKRLLLLLATGCAADPGRDAVLHDWLVADNAPWRSRDPALLEGKYARMAEDPYDFLRGTAGLFWADLGRVGSTRIETSFLTTPEASTVWLVGDPHPENLSTMRPGDPAVGWQDLDASTWGPWVGDLRRAAQGVAVLATGVAGCDEACVADAVAAVPTGYSAAIGGAVLPPGAALGALVAEAQEEGPLRERLLDNTEVVDGERRLLVDASLGLTGAGVLPLDADDGRRVATWTAAYAPRAPDGFRVLDAARRFGRGVSSWPAFRYVVLWDRGQDGDADDDILEAREVLSPPPMPGGVPRLFPDDAARIDLASGALWPDDADDAAAAVLVGNQTFKALSYSSWFQGLDRVDVEDDFGAGDLDAGDLADLGRGVGAVLAQAHARGITANGEPALEVIVDDLDGRDDLLIEEISTAAAVDAARTLDDYERFLDLLDRWGPLLGAEVLR